MILTNSSRLGEGNRLGMPPRTRHFSAVDPNSVSGETTSSDNAGDLTIVSADGQASQVDAAGNMRSTIHSVALNAGTSKAAIGSVQSDMTVQSNLGTAATGPIETGGFLTAAATGAFTNTAASMGAASPETTGGTLNATSTNASTDLTETQATTTNIQVTGDIYDG